MGLRLSGRVAVVLTLVALAASGGAPWWTQPAAEAQAPRPPAQPATGPGGEAADYAGVEARRVGGAPTGSWVFAPSDPRAGAGAAGEGAGGAGGEFLARVHVS